MPYTDKRVRYPIADHIKPSLTVKHERPDLRWAGRRGGGHRGGLLAALLLVVADPPRLGLQLPHLAEVEPHRTGAEGVGLGASAVLLEGGAEAAHEGVEGTPCLAERARAGGRGAGVAEERTTQEVDFGLPELVQIAEEFQHVGPAAAGEGQRRAVVVQILTKGVPIPPLLGLVPARGR
ncbi:hypothetical protein HPP92_014388 [Vanilla planifolia]|uniref:Uncharacterized protein n=1 Tax=Vanilla planifolia TaxID=51239 RepID=A0A835QVQ7_VANPL|nr:hypothetical protein HPP92_014758 [Vanilla planifolia]KAG0474702.1 hypothetical protein HPP92_014388 [Vanilla planifolia]